MPKRSAGSTGAPPERVLRRVAAWYGAARMSSLPLPGPAQPSAAGARLALQGLTPMDLVARVPGVQLDDARRLLAAFHAGRDFTQPSSSVRRTSRQAVRDHCSVPTLSEVERHESPVDGFMKLVLRTPDERLIECVRIPLERAGRFTICVSSQVGCALACAFCATGKLGLGRNLETWEMVEQVRMMRATLVPALGQRVHGVVFQGMGEPLANLDRVIGAARVMFDPNGLGIDGRNITVSTAGLPAGIQRLAEELPRVRLAWSIGSARPGARAALMPIDRAHPLEETYAACVDHARRTELSPLWAVTLLAGVNDSVDDAEALAHLALRFERESGRRARISVIPYNAIGDAGSDPFRRSSDEVEGRFRDAMAAAGVFTHKRYSGGGDVAAACGQLARTSGAAPARRLRVLG